MNETLRALTRAMGVLEGFQDTSGVWRETSPETARALLSAMGLAVSTDAEVAETLAGIEAERAARAILPWHVVEAGQSWWLHLSRPVDKAVLTLEDGTVIELPGGEGLDLPALPLGLHKLEVAGDVATVLAAPPHLPLPERSWGVTLPLYGLRPPEEPGLASYADLAEAVRALAPHGVGFVGINPIHAGFPADPAAVSPYSPSHRRRLSVAHLTVPGDAGGHTGPLVDTQADLPLRLAALRAAFEASDPNDPGFAEWCVTEGDELALFALHQALSDKFGPYWPDWAAPYRDVTSPEVAAFAREHPRDIAFHAWLQWQADLQVGAAAAAAREAGMPHGLYLDLAVGTNPAGAETWAEPEAFASGVSLGAPPDAFSPAGQAWGLAPLDPHQLVADRFGLFADTLRAQLRHAKLLRIDHILGVERAFWVPKDGTPGGYVAMPREALLAVIRIEATRAGASVIGEDLGNVPHGLRDAMAASGLLGCRVAMFEEEHGHPRHAENYPEAVVASFGTHDLPTWLGWREGRDISARESLGIVSPEDSAAAQEARAAAVAAFDAVAGTHHADPAALHSFLARTPARLVSLQIEDILGLADQPNLPGTVDGFPNWRRRLPVGPKALAELPAMRDAGQIMTASGRGEPR